jgi:glycerol-3-phosphate dehydrogenase
VSASGEHEVAVIGGGVVGCAVAHALARRGVASIVLEAEPGLALGASGSNSGILHTGFDSPRGTLETDLILRSAILREELLEELGVVALRCGARLSPGDERERAAVADLASNARGNGVPVVLGADGSLGIPGESVIDPVAFVHALARAAQTQGAEVRLGSRVDGLTGERGGGLVVSLNGGEQLRVRAAVNCAGLHGDEIARLAGDLIPAIYPRKGEFLVFAAPADERLEQILLPVPSSLGKGVLVFPTVDGEVIAGPTAREREDKRDFSVEPDAAELILPRAVRMYPPLARAEHLGAYAGLRPAGRDANYVIGRSRALRGLIHVAAIRSTGLSASLGIGEHVAGMLAEDGAVVPGEIRPLEPESPLAVPGARAHWWERAAEHHAVGNVR